MVVGHGTRDGVTIGPLIDDRAVDKAEEHVQDAIRRGARLVTGGHRLTDGEYAAGSFYEPTVLEGVTPDMLISTEETFGPVAGISRFETEEEAISLANDSVYGLAAYFHTRDYARLLRVAEKLQYGIVGANSGHHQRRERPRSAASRNPATDARAAPSASTSTSTSSTCSSAASASELVLLAQGRKPRKRFPPRAKTLKASASRPQEQ